MKSRFDVGKQDEKFWEREDVTDVTDVTDRKEKVFTCLHPAHHAHTPEVLLKIGVTSVTCYISERRRECDQDGRTCFRPSHRLCKAINFN
jgi:hypothetical protein